MASDGFVGAEATGASFAEGSSATAASAVAVGLGSIAIVSVA